MEISSNFLNHLRSASGNTVTVQSIQGQATTSRRVGVSAMESPMETLQLVMSRDGVLDWQPAGTVIPGLKQRRRAGVVSSASSSQEIVTFERLAPSAVTQFLINQDARLTPQTGMRRFDLESGLKQQAFPANGNVLLFVHGTFSNSDNVMNSLTETEFGRSFLKQASKRYSHIFAFDHPTLSVSPVVNALDLQNAISNSSAKIDIITHSRGGLVTRWWCETFDPKMQRCSKAILVGSPLAGTGLAAPPNIRRTLKLLTNYGNTLVRLGQVAALAAPILGVVNVLLQTITSITTIAAATPIADAAMGMIPGLYGQSRIGNNVELVRLHALTSAADRYFAVQSNFVPEGSIWQFWKCFTTTHLANLASDMIFDGPNDMVVDTASMSYLSKASSIPNSRILDFGNSPDIHHMNYFGEAKVIEFFRKSLGLDV